MKRLKTVEAMDEFLREATLLSSLNHPAVVHFYGIWIDQNEQHIVTEFMSEGALNDYVRTNKESLNTDALLEM